MIFNLLAESTSTSQNATTQNGGFMWIIIIIAFVALIAFNYFSNKKRTEQAEKEKEKRNAIKPGFIVTTIGAIVGTVVEVNDEENTFVLKTGSEENYSFIKFDKLAIYSSQDPNAVTAEPQTEETPVETSEEVVESTEEVEIEEKVTSTEESDGETNE